MPAPTALQKKPDELSAAADVPLPVESQDEELLLDAPMEMNDVQVATEGDDAVMRIDEEGRPKFAAQKNIDGPARIETRKVPIPPHRMAPLKATWPKIYPPLVEHLKLQVRMNIKSKSVELRTSKATTDNGALQMGEDFVKAFALGFDVDDAIALLRVSELYIETVIKDVKTLQGEHLGRAIGRIAGKDGKTKFAIENASRTRVVLADSKIHILGGFKNIHIAREAIVSLILGSPPSKVYGNLRTVASRMKERF
ncbi:hypothetical protein B0O99DRAFT_518 [Bisporella sp. PMI_857]|nr:hypothetical protein B0O99DRAFT_518 [Bisporella sp. PMI_857]